MMLATCKKNTNYSYIVFYDLIGRPDPFYDFTLFVVLSLFMGGSLHEGRRYSACVGGTIREKREANK